MRAFPIAAIAVLLGASHALAEADCRTAGEITGYVHQQDSSVQYVTYSVAPLRLVFSKPDREKFMIVQFDTTQTRAWSDMTFWRASSSGRGLTVSSSNDARSFGIAERRQAICDHVDRSLR